MTRVLHLVESWPPAPTGYAARSAALVAAQLAHPGIEPAVLVSSRQHLHAPAPADRTDGPAVPVTALRPTLREHRRRRAHRWWVDGGALHDAVVAAARRHRAEVVHVHWSSTIGASAADAARTLGVPLIAEVRFDLASAVTANGTGRDLPVVTSLLRAWFERHLRRADVVVAASEALLPLVERVAPRHAGRVVVAPNGVDGERFRPGPPAPTLRDRFGLPPDALVVGSVTNVLRYERLDRLVASLAALDRDDVTGLVVGDGPALPALREAAARAAVPLVLPGRVDARTAAAAWRLLDVVVVPRGDLGVTRWASPLKLAEAMACGRAVVATAVGGATTLLADGRGVLVAPDDVGALTSALGRLLDDGALRQRLGDAAREHATTTLRWSAAADAHARAYRLATVGAYSSR